MKVDKKQKKQKNTKQIIISTENFLAECIYPEDVRSKAEDFLRNKLKIDGLDKANDYFNDVIMRLQELDDNVLIAKYYVLSSEMVAYFDTLFLEEQQL